LAALAAAGFDHGDIPVPASEAHIKHNLSVKQERTDSQVAMMAAIETAPVASHGTSTSASESCTTNKNL